MTVPDRFQRLSRDYSEDWRVTGFLAQVQDEREARERRERWTAAVAVGVALGAVVSLALALFPVIF